MKKLALSLSALVSLGLLAPSVSARPVDEPQSHNQQQRDMLDPEYFLPPYNQKVTSPLVRPLQVIRQGKRLSPTTVLNNPNWVRPVYRTYWSPSYSGGRWSDPKTRIHYALHRTFASYLTGSIFYDFIHNVGIEQEMLHVPALEKNAFDKMIFVVMQADVKGVYAYRNQIVIVATPQRTGLHVFTINTADVPSTHPKTRKEANVVQLITPNGQEIDYWVI